MDTSVSVIPLYKLNDVLTSELAEWGWAADTEEDYEAIDNLTHDVYGLIQSFAEEAASSGSMAL